jgi:hypothetical protein
MNTKSVNIPGSDASESVLEALAQSQRRLKWLAGAAVGFWTLAILASLAVLIFYPVFYAPKERQMMRDLGSNGASASYEAKASADASPPPVTERDMRQHLGNQFIMTYVITKGILVVAGSVVILSCGTLATLLLVIFHRRVTLEQINHSLAQISAQLQELQKG